LNPLLSDTGLKNKKWKLIINEDFWSWKKKNWTLIK
jgi:hypothetical protein